MRGTEYFKDELSADLGRDLFLLQAEEDAKVAIVRGRNPRRAIAEYIFTVARQYPPRNPVRNVSRARARRAVESAIEDNLTAMALKMRFFWHNAIDTGWLWRRRRIGRAGPATLAGFTATTFEIAQEKGRTTVEGYVRGRFGIHMVVRSINKNRVQHDDIETWTVTHLATGMAVATYLRSRAAAVRIVKRIEGYPAAEDETCAGAVGKAILDYVCDYDPGFFVRSVVTPETHQYWR